MVCVQWHETASFANPLSRAQHIKRCEHNGVCPYHRHEMFFRARSYAAVRGCWHLWQTVSSHSVLKMVRVARELGRGAKTGAEHWRKHTANLSLAGCHM